MDEPQRRARHVAPVRWRPNAWRIGAARYPQRTAREKLMTRFAKAAVVPLLALLLATQVGCWPGNSKHETAVDKETKLIDKERRWARCMRDNGVDVPDPKSNGGGIAMEGGTGAGEATKMDKAFEACKKYEPQGGDLPKPKPADVAKLREYSKCMREHGVPEFPDPDSEGGIKLDTSVLKPGPTLEKAQKACEKVAPGMGGVGFGSTEGGSPGDGK
jgi:hypothetical protein